MMTSFLYFPIFNLAEFLALNLPSKQYDFNFDGVGDVSILVVKGNEVSVIYDNVMLPIQSFDKNPVTRGTYKVAITTDNQVWLGMGVAA